MLNYRSSSAAYRAIRFYEAKNGKTNLVVEKLGTKDYIVKSGDVKITYNEFLEKVNHIRNIQTKTEFRYFPVGVNGEGYYELKTGNRRRPNSISISLRSVYNGIVDNVFEIM